ncbi:hypothetical protein PIB30_041681 [Stylosanthes scabra]|uniref:Uncharacterized protein n=1 Tax=Stylosanthes scabra TaxID=79078 RepID=A0ABU6TF60_9FABA|nr:hypothetical protein [Stylosanthes scabra]
MNHSQERNPVRLPCPIPSSTKPNRYQPSHPGCCQLRSFRFASSVAASHTSSIFRSSHRSPLLLRFRVGEFFCSLLHFGSSTSEILETAFKKETVGLVIREQYVEKRVNIQSKIEEEEKEKLQKQQQEEEELQLEKRKKRKIKGNSRLSFAEDVDNDAEEEEPQDSKRLLPQLAEFDGSFETKLHFKDDRDTKIGSEMMKHGMHLTFRLLLTITS